MDKDIVEMYLLGTSVNTSSYILKEKKVLAYKNVSPVREITTEKRNNNKLIINKSKITPKTGKIGALIYLVNPLK